MSLKYWQSLEQLAESPEVLDRISREFPGYDPDQISSLSRRRFMKLMGASMGLAGLTLTGCRRWPEQELAPYSSSPRDHAAGAPEYFATVYELDGVGNGLLVTSYDGRPVKVEGNPSHPYAQTFDGKLGAADAFAQASVLELYDPDRSRSIIDRTAGTVRSATFAEFLRGIGTLKASDGKGFAVLSEPSNSPSVADMRQRLFKTYPQAAWYEFAPLSRENERAAFDRPMRTKLMLGSADVIVSLDADILGSHPAHIRHANDWARRRRTADEKKGMNRLYIAESCLSITGAVADERLGVKPSRVQSIAMGLANRLGISTDAASLSPDETKFVDAAAADLRRNGLLVAGFHLPPAVHAVVSKINSAIGAIGKTVAYLPEPANPSQPLEALCQRISAGEITTLLIMGGNPAYDAPADLGFADLLSAVPTTIHLSLYDNETSQRCRWHLPRAHYLESWGDARAWDGTLSIQQPLILPLYGGKSTVEVLALIGKETETDGRSIVRRTFASVAGNDSEMAFRRVLHDGLLPDSQFAAATPAPRNLPMPGIDAKPGLELRFQPDQKLYDGRFANSGWLQELPDSLTKLTWDNPALFSQKDAAELRLSNGDMIEITVGDRTLAAAAFIHPGQPLGVIGIALGYGRSAAGNVGNGIGFNAYALRTRTALGSAAVAKVGKTGASYPLAATQEHHLIDEVGMKGREQRVGEKGHGGSIIHEATLAEYEKDPQAPHHGEHRTVELQIFNPPSQFNSPHAWGMAVDMSACIGCNACVIACQAENNIPVVGKDQVMNNREMHWIRIDRYFKGSAEDPQPDLVFQPMMCVHCENAPCEQVCPVGATVHDTEGLNVMVYNRCIGTRYCSNNCPYKVRRFNYFDWQSKDPRGRAHAWLGMPDSQQQESISKIKQMVFNPEVTVRMRGVMEKCTYCVQRIHTTEQAKRLEGKDLVDGDVVSACQQSCPTEAIVFGNLNDPNSRVSKLHSNPRAYSVLDDLNTRPRTKHLAKLRNPTGKE